MRWVLLRGLTREAGHWADFAAALEQRSGAPVLPLDLAGNGSRFAARSPMSVDAMAADCIDRAGPATAPVVLVAMSLGAMVALQWCRRAPDSVAGCVLINTSGSGASPFWQRLQPRNYAVLARLFLPGLGTIEREQRVLAMTSAVPHRHPEAAQRWAALARAHPVRPANAARQLWAAARYHAPALPPPVPMLLLASRGDRLVSPACSERLAAQWGVPLRMHPWAGHDLPLDDPQWLLGQLLEWNAARVAGRLQTR